jgi:hypothetical protein
MGHYWDQNGEPQSLPQFVNVVGIVYDTLKTHVTSSKNKTKREVGGAQWVGAITS